MYCRKIVIISGQDKAYQDVKGIVTLSTEADGVCAKLSLYRLTPVQTEFRLVIACGSCTVARSFVAKGLAEEVFMTDLPLLPTDKIHVLVGVKETGKPVAYGSNSGVPMWESGLVAALLTVQDIETETADTQVKTVDGRGAASRYASPSATAVPLRVATACQQKTVEGSDEAERLVQFCLSADMERGRQSEKNGNGCSFERQSVPRTETADSRIQSSAQSHVSVFTESAVHAATETVQPQASVAVVLNQPTDLSSYMKEENIRSRLADVYGTEADPPAGRERKSTPPYTVDGIADERITPASENPDVKTAYEIARERARRAYDDERVADYNYYNSRIKIDRPTGGLAAMEAAAEASLDSWGGYNTIHRTRLDRKKTVETKIVPSVPKYYLSVKNALDALFRSCKEDEMLNGCLSGTRWVRVPYRSGQHYCVGLIGSVPDYIGYAVPGTFNLNPPRQLAGLSKFLPKSAESPEGDGYWIMFQDACTGGSVRLD